MYTAISPAVALKQARETASRIVKERTGMQISVLQYPTETVNTTPQRMLYVIAMALDMSPESYKLKTRVRPVVELRFVASLLLRQHFPALTLHQIAAYFGGQDHSSVINGISRAHNLLYVRDIPFVKKYNTALKSVTSWLRQDVSVYALPASA